VTTHTVAGVASEGEATGREAFPPRSWLRLLPPLLAFATVLIGHALYLRHATAVALAAPVADGWADSAAEIGGTAGPWDLGPYLAAGDYWLGLSYGLGAAFAAWALGQFLRTRRTAMAAGAAGSVTLVGVLMAAGCYLLGCCGSPMLGVYVAVFGANVLGVGKPLQFAITLVSVVCGCWCLSRRRVTCATCPPRDLTDSGGCC
jgi:hypothetical protein